MAEEIWDYYLSQYKEKEFVLKFTLVVYLNTFKVSVFYSIIVYNTDFQIILYKFANPGLNLPQDLQLAAYLHKIKNKYPDFAVFQRSAARIKILTISEIMAKFKDKVCISYKSTTLPA